VLPHDGPNWRDYPRFNWLVQFLATRGYSVLQPQFRGSRGFGEAFEKAGYREWGGLMQDDVSDGVRAMIDQGIADPHHVCIVGMGYGGYAALAGAAFTPTLYTCAASINGIADLRALMSAQLGLPEHRKSAAEAVWKERVGAETDPRLGTKSPINSVAAITIPMMIVYTNGLTAEDQSIPMAKALKKAGKAVEVVQLPEEATWLSRSDTRTQLLEALETFLQQHLQAR
jgi:dipeptidyl aminopeptidase/acylaminoacyl peptidase